ncbi:hypothetical protein BC828DRAFT_373596 [Blastocladiella britannica]|nr:hypothetical protein BC828DRAFT_373596 [Blastocladiella britannica]
MATRPASLSAYPDLANVDGSVALSRENTHTAPELVLSPSLLSVRGSKGYRMAKCNFGAHQGRWYYEVTIDSLGDGGNGNARFVYHLGLGRDLGLAALAGLDMQTRTKYMDIPRIGWATISAPLQAPCGMDVFSYAYRVQPGTLFHASHPLPWPPGCDADRYSAGLQPGDVLGVTLYLPEPTADQLAWLESHTWLPSSTRGYAKIEYSLPLPLCSAGAQIRYSVNGRDLGVAFADLPLHLGKYHPAIALYRDAAVTANFGPQFRFPPANLASESTVPLIPLPPRSLSTAKAVAETEVAAPLRAAALLLMHGEGRVFPFYRVRDVCPGIKLPGTVSHPASAVTSPTLGRPFKSEPPSFLSFSLADPSSLPAPARPVPLSVEIPVTESLPAMLPSEPPLPREDAVDDVLS